MNITLFKVRFWKTRLFIIASLTIGACLFLYQAQRHITFFGMAPDMGLVDENVKKFIGLKIPDTISTPVSYYGTAWCDSSYEFAFDADASWKEAFMKRFNMIPDPKAKAYYFSSTLSSSIYITDRVSKEMQHKMVSFTCKTPFRYDGREWNVVLLIDPDGTLCFLKLYEDAPTDRSLHNEID